MNAEVLVPLRTYHGPVEFGWDGLKRGGVTCVEVNRVLRSEPTKCTLICGSHTNQPTVVKSLSVSVALHRFFGD